LFSRKNQTRRVECQSPWNIDGFHLILKKPEKNVIPKEMDFLKTIFWIQAHNLPLEYISEENAEKIGNCVGSFLEVDLVGAADAHWGNFLRIKEELCAKNPLLNGCWMERAPISDLWIQLICERLSDFCYECGRLGHLKRDCNWKQPQQHLSSQPSTRK
jgi:hypothetical protein